MRTEFFVALGLYFFSGVFFNAPGCLKLCLERLRGLCRIVVRAAKRFGDDFIDEPEFFQVIRAIFSASAASRAAAGLSTKWRHNLPD